MLCMTPGRTCTATWTSSSSSIRRGSLISPTSQIQSETSPALALFTHAAALSSMERNNERKIRVHQNSSPSHSRRSHFSVRLRARRDNRSTCVHPAPLVSCHNPRERGSTQDLSPRCIYSACTPTSSAHSSRPDVDYQRGDSDQEQMLTYLLAATRSRNSRPARARATGGHEGALISLSHRPSRKAGFFAWRWTVTKQFLWTPVPRKRLRKALLPEHAHGARAYPASPRL